MQVAGATGAVTNAVRVSVKLFAIGEIFAFLVVPPFINQGCAVEFAVGGCV